MEVENSTMLPVRFVRFTLGLTSVFLFHLHMARRVWIVRRFKITNESSILK